MKSDHNAIKNFVDHHYRHFNAAALKDAAVAYDKHLKNGGKMFVTLAGAMSTAELGLSLAQMIREDKVHGICCTGANLEEDLFNLVAHSKYERIPHYRDLTPQDEQKLLEKHMNRVTDTCIPEEEAMRKIEVHLFERWANADQKNQSFFPYEFIFQIFEEGKIQKDFEIDAKDSWLYAAWEKKIPIFVPGWEDSTTGNFFASHLISGKLSNPHTVRSGIETMMSLSEWYQSVASSHSIGFFQVGGGIAGDFPICVVPMIHQDLGKEDVPLWGYFCQISDSTTSYGSYSGAVPNEKITWGKLGPDTPKFVVESDATIVAPLIFSYILAC